MPLIKSKSDKAFKKNVATEVKAGKPVKQAVAIAYDVKRRSKKASGGAVHDDVAEDKKLTEECLASVPVQLGFLVGVTLTTQSDKWGIVWRADFDVPPAMRPFARAGNRYFRDVITWRLR